MGDVDTENDYGQLVDMTLLPLIDSVTIILVMLGDFKQRTAELLEQFIQHRLPIRKLRGTEMDVPANKLSGTPGRPIIDQDITAAQLFD